MKPRDWYRFRPQDAAKGSDGPDTADLDIFDIIGAGWFDDGVTAKQFIADLKALPASIKTLRVAVNSPGGDVFDAVAIANALKQCPMAVEMTVVGLAASAATIITCAGDAIRMADNALMMVHNPSGFCVGAAADMRQTADELDKVRAAIIATYRWVSSLSDDQLGEMMDKTTWMDPQEAIDAGFATEIVSGLKAAASLDRRALDRLPAPPEKFRARIERLLAAPPPAPADPRAIVGACREAGLLEMAEDLFGQPMDVVTARLEREKLEREARAGREKEIRALCQTAKFSDLADAYISGGMSVGAVRAQLTMLAAKRDAGVIDAAPDGAAIAPPTTNTNPVSTAVDRMLERANARTTRRAS